MITYFKFVLFKIKQVMVKIMSKHGFFGGIKREAKKNHKCVKCKNIIKIGEFYCDVQCRYRTCNNCSYLYFEAVVRDKPDFRLFEIEFDYIIDYRPNSNTIFQQKVIGPHATRRIKL